MASFVECQEAAPMCRCGKGIMTTHTSHTEKNPGRFYYKCPMKMEHKNSFVWCDLIHQLEANSASSSTMVPTNHDNRDPELQTMLLKLLGKTETKPSGIHVCSTDCMFFWMSIWLCALCLVVLGILIGKVIRGTYHEGIG